MEAVATVVLTGSKLRLLFAPGGEKASSAAEDALKVEDAHIAHFTGAVVGPSKTFHRGVSYQVK